MDGQYAAVRFLSGSELWQEFEKITQKPRLEEEDSLLVGGQKRISASHSDAEKVAAQERATQVSQLLRRGRVEKHALLCLGEWVPEHGLVRLTRLKGNSLLTRGHYYDGSYWLYPEEALFMMESNLLALSVRGVRLSTEEAYSLFADPTPTESDSSAIFTPEIYAVYGHLVRLGYILSRVTSNTYSPGSLSPASSVDLLADPASPEFSISHVGETEGSSKLAKLRWDEPLESDVGTALGRHRGKRTVGFSDARERKLLKSGSASMDLGGAREQCKLGFSNNWPFTCQPTDRWRTENPPSRCKKCSKRVKFSFDHTFWREVGYVTAPPVCEIPVVEATTLSISAVDQQAGGNLCEVMERSSTYANQSGLRATEGLEQNVDSNGLISGRPLGGYSLPAPSVPGNIQSWAQFKTWRTSHDVTSRDLVGVGPALESYWANPENDSLFRKSGGRGSLDAFTNCLGVIGAGGASSSRFPTSLMEERNSVRFNVYLPTPTFGKNSPGDPFGTICVVSSSDDSGTVPFLGDLASPRGDPTAITALVDESGGPSFYRIICQGEGDAAVIPNMFRNLSDG